MHLAGQVRVESWPIQYLEMLCRRPQLTCLKMPLSICSSSIQGVQLHDAALPVQTRPRRKKGLQLQAVPCKNGSWESIWPLGMPLQDVQIRHGIITCVTENEETRDALKRRQTCSIYSCTSHQEASKRSQICGTFPKNHKSELDNFHQSNPSQQVFRVPSCQVDI